MRTTYGIRSWSLGVLTLVLAAACGARGSPGSSPSPTPTPTPSPTGTPKSLPQLQLAVLDAVGGRLDYCDPDLYPVEHGDPVSNARDRLPMIEADTEAFQAILEHEHLTADQPFTDQQLVTINEDYKQMQAIDLQPAVDGYRFSVLVPKPAAPSANERASGVVSPLGQVTIEQRAPGVRPNCPICLAGGVLIDTASGAVPVQDIRAGMRVWTTDAGGRRVVAVVDEVGHVLAPMGHEVVRVVLGDGRIVTASPGHPTADGRTVGELRPGDVLDGSEVVSASLIAYAGAATYDLLPSGPTGTYFANGILLGSTLRQTMADVPGVS